MRVSGKILNQIFLEVLINCTKHFDLSTSLTASCVARFMIRWECQLYFSGLVCLALSLDECLININYGLFSVAPRWLFRLTWHRVWLICSVKRCYYWTMIFLRKMAEFLFGGLVAVNFMVNIMVCYSWIGSFNVRILNNCKCVARWILCHYWLLREFFWLFRG